jgi:ribonuclease HII
MIELKLLKDFPCEIIAIDEVGRSSLIGPVVIGGVHLKVHHKEDLESLLRSLRRIGVKDSKLLSHQQREKLLQKLDIPLIDFRKAGEFHWKGITCRFVTWEMDHHVIDLKNIFQATMLGMKEVAIHLATEPTHRITVLLDGQSKLRWEQDAPAWEEHAIVKGDLKSPLIGLASIIAKEKRDAFMRQMHELFPVYGLVTNSGYPTREHREAIRIHGPCEFHRKSFNKVKEFIR